jgi:hypothetical protein
MKRYAKYGGQEVFNVPSVAVKQWLNEAKMRLNPNASAINARIALLTSTT